MLSAAGTPEGLEAGVTCSDPPSAVRGVEQGARSGRRG